MVRRFELIVFNWDGTLMDSTAAIVCAIQSSAQNLGLPIPSEAAARQVIGLGLRDALALAVPQLPTEQYAEMSARYKYHYLINSQSIYLFDGISDLMQALKTKGHLLAVATGKSRQGLNDALERSGLGLVMDATRCVDECFSKPHPQMLEELMNELGVSAKATVMIGDTTHDLQMATNAGVASVGVSYGAHDKQALHDAGSIICCDTVEELRQWLHQNA